MVANQAAKKVEVTAVLKSPAVVSGFKPNRGITAQVRADRPV